MGYIACRVACVTKIGAKQPFMNPINTSLVTLITLLLFSCSREEPVDISRLELEGERFYLREDDDPFSGKATSSYADGQIKSEQNYRDGALSGPSRSWYQNGNQKSEEHYENNRLAGQSTYFRQDGTIKLTISISEGLLDGNFYYQEDDYSYNADFSKGVLSRREIQYQLVENTIIQTYENRNLSAVEINPEGAIVATTQQAYPVMITATARIDNGMLAITFLEDDELGRRLFFRHGDVVMQENYVDGELDILLYHDRSEGKRIYHCYYEGSMLQPVSDEICASLPPATQAM